MIHFSSTSANDELGMYLGCNIQYLCFPVTVQERVWGAVPRFRWGTQQGQHSHPRVGLWGHLPVPGGGSGRETHNPLRGGVYLHLLQVAPALRRERRQWRRPIPGECPVVHRHAPGCDLPRPGLHRCLRHQAQPGWQVCRPGTGGAPGEAGPLRWGWIPRIHTTVSQTGFF